MRYTRRHLTLIVGFGLVFLSAAGNAAAPSFNGALRGEYDMTLTRTCVVSSAFDSNFQPTGGSSFVDITLRGVINYNGQISGGGSFTGESLATGSEVGSGAGVLQSTRAAQSCTVVDYAVNAGGGLAQQLNCTLLFTAGAIGTDLAISGKTATLNGIELQGQLSLDWTVVLLSDSNPTVETFTCPSCTNAGSPGITNQRVCSGSGTATSRR